MSAPLATRFTSDSRNSRNSRDSRELSGRARLAVLASGSGSNLGAILSACADGSLNADVVLVAGDRPNAGAFDRAAAAGVPATAVLEVPADRSLRRAWAGELAEIVGAHQPDWIILAGFMRILPAEFLDRFPNKVVNLHPALPGEFPGTRAIERAFEEARKGSRASTGIMVHLVPDEGIDDGPVLATRIVPILPTDDLESLSARVHEAEHVLLVETLRTLTNTSNPTRN
jgi:phosphoribosylglycinamide formyltransferase 1